MKKIRGGGFLIICVFWLLYLWSCSNSFENDNEISQMQKTLEEQADRLEQQDKKIEILEQRQLFQNRIEEKTQGNELNTQEEISRELTLEEKIADIKEKFRIVNFSAENYKKYSATLFGESSGGNEIIGFYNQDKNNHVDKIVEKYYGDMWKGIIEYYFWEDELFFVYSKESHYNKPITFDDSKIEKEEENRYYFWEDELIKWMQPWAVVASIDDQAKQRALDFIVESREYKEFLKHEGKIVY